jgi:hypothetical protein
MEAMNLVWWSIKRFIFVLAKYGLVMGESTIFS